MTFLLHPPEGNEFESVPILINVKIDNSIYINKMAGYIDHNEIQMIR